MFSRTFLCGSAALQTASKRLVTLNSCRLAGRSHYILARRLNTRATHVAPLLLHDVESDDLSIERATTLKPKHSNETLKFGGAFTDHMLEVDWDNKNGWGKPLISKYHNLQIDPASTVLHYALQCFEGMKAYVDDNGAVRLFRPMENMKRLRRSCERLYFPTFNEDNVLECIKRLVVLEKDWIPKGEGYSLYLRPTVISNHNAIGVAPAQSVKLFCILSPVGPYYTTGYNAVTLYADDKNVRAWPGGSGNSKIGSNYGPTIRPQMEAAAMGYAQILWLCGDDYKVTEVGTMNQFFFWKNEMGKKELITAPLDDGTILPGITRKSILQLARQWGEFEVTERTYTIHEVIAAIEEDRMIESFGAGTATVVSPVKGFHFKGKDYEIPLDPQKPTEQAGPLARRFSETVMGIQYGRIPHEWSEVIWSP